MRSLRRWRHRGGRRRADRHGLSIPSFGLFLLVLSLSGACTSYYLPNIKAASELGEKRLLAGRITLFDNNEAIKPETAKLKVWINKQGAEKAQALEPDEHGYVYVPVETGQYNLANYTVAGIGTFTFKLPTFPTVQVYDSDKAVNFGTIEVWFYQGTGSKIANVLAGWGRGHVRVKHVREYDGVRAVLESKFGAGASPIRNEVPVFRLRTK